METKQSTAFETISILAKQIVKSKKRREVLDKRMVRLERIFFDKLHEENRNMDEIKTRVTMVLQRITREQNSLNRAILVLYETMANINL